MTTKVFPDGPELPLDQARLAGLICDAIRSALRDLRQSDVSGAQWLIFRPTERGWGSTYLPAPFYRKAEVWDQIARVWNSREAAALTEYICAHGALKKTLTRDDDQDPTREAWERFVWGDLVHAPLLDLLPMAAAEDLVRTGEYCPWRIDDQVIEEAAADLADQICKQGRTITAICPTIGLQLGEGKIVTAAPGIEIRGWSNEERMIFLTRYHEEYLQDDMSTWASQGAITIRKRVGGLSDEISLTAITSALDSLKWALMVATNNPVIFEEGPVVSRGLSGWRMRTLRRGDTLMRSRSLPNVNVTLEVASSLPPLFAELDQARQISNEIDSVLWLFGRACTAVLARDSLLDSVIGLEMLLVPNPGESRYRFTLHGLAIIEGESPQTLEADLRAIYDLRSKAAHGGSSDARNFESLAPRARLLLAKAIRGAARLMRTGELDMVNTKGDIAKSVENLVKSRSASAPRTA